MGGRRNRFVAPLRRRLAPPAAILAGLILTGVAVLHLPSVRSRVLAYVQGYTERELGVELRASRLDYSLLARSIELRDLSVSAVGADPPFLQADRAVVVVGPGIFLGHTSVHRVSLSRPRLVLVRNADGSVNLPSPTKGPSSASPMRLGTVSITGGLAQLDDRVSRRSVTLGPLDVSVNTAGTRPGDLGPSPFTVRTGDVQITGTIGGRVSFDGTRVRLDRLTADTNAGRVVLDGWADLLGARAGVSSQVKATINLAQAAGVARIDARGLAGRVDADIDVTGTLDAPAITLRVASRDASYAPLGPVRLMGRSSLSATRAQIDTLDIESAAGSLHADGTIGTASRLAVRWANLQLDDLARTFGRSLPVRSGSLASGSAAIEFDAHDLGARAWSRVRADATTTLQPASTGSGADALALSGVADLHLDRGRWSLHHWVRLSRGRAELAGDMTGRLLDADTPRSTLAGRSRVRVDDVGALSTLISAVGVRLPPALTEGLSGSMQATIDLGDLIENPTARIDVRLQDLRTPLPSRAAVEASLWVDTNGITAQHVRAAAGTSTFNGSGQYLWRGPLKASIELDQGDLSEISGYFGSPARVVGSARLTGTLTGVPRSVHARLALSARDLAVDQVAIGSLTGAGTVNLAAGGLVEVHATAPALGARADVEIINRTGYPFSGEIALEHQNIGDLVPARYRNEIGDVSGRLRATARGSGRLSDPAGIRGRIDVGALDAVWRGTRFTAASPGSVIVDADRMAVNALDLRIGQSTRATLGGQLGVTPLPDALRLHLDGPLSELIDIGTRTVSARPVNVRGQGTATLDVMVGGTLDHPLPTGTLTVRSPSLEYGTFPAVSDVNLDASIDPTIITLRTFAARWQGASIGGEGLLPWRVVLEPWSLSSRLAGWMQALPPEPARARMIIRADDVTPAVLNGVVAPQRLSEIQGNVAATLTVEADRPSLDAIHATAVLDRASLTLGGVAFTQSVPSRLTIQDGRARIADVRWSAEGNSLTASGGINLIATPAAMDLGLSGVLNLRVLGAFLPDIRPAGRAEVDFKVGGSFNDPTIVGRIRIAHGALQWDSPRFVASDLDGALQFAAGRKVSVSVAGALNTGSVRLDGTVDLGDLANPIGNVRFTGRDVALEYPSGLQTESNADLTLVRDHARSTLTGRIDVLGGTYREPLVLSRQLLNLTAGSGIVTTAAPADWMSGIGLDVAIATTSDVRIDNNYGRLDAGATLRLIGTAAHPGVLGRVQAADEGEIYLGGNAYRIERLTIDLANPRAVTPEVSFAAQTRVGDLPIGIDLHCPAARPCERKITSLATNVDDKEAEARLLGTVGTTAAAGETLARLLSGELLGVVGRTVGLDVLRLEQTAGRRDIFDDPTLISGDVDPAARLTLAKRVGSNVELVYSQNLADKGFTWSTSYIGPYGLSGRLLILDDQSRAYEFRHEPPLGAARTSRRPPPPGPRVTAVTIVGTPGFAENEIRRLLRLAEGDRFTFGAWQRDRDRLERFYRTHDFVEARIRARRLQAQPPDDTVALEYAIARGPTTQLIIRGVALPDDVRERIVSRWTSALFDGFLEKDARTIVREHLYRSGYLQAAVTAVVATDTSRDLKTLTIDVVPGSIVLPRIEVTGNSSVPTEELLGAISQQDTLSPWLNPGSVKRLLEDHYRSEGYLAADVSVGSPENLDGSSLVAIHVNEGPPYAVGEVEVSGLPQETEPGSREALGLSPGARYQPANVADGVEQLERRLRNAAYRQSTVDVDTRVDGKAARVDIAVRVTPGPRSILRDVVVGGGDATKSAIARSIVLETGAPLDVEAIAETRRRLYDLDVYRSVDVDVEPLASDTVPSAGAALEEPVVARIALEERPRYRLRYGLAINDEVVGPDQRDQRLGVAADFENRNVLGSGASAGVSVRLRSDQQVARVTGGATRFFGLPIRSTVFVEREREQLDPDAAFPITTDISSLSAEQAYRVRPGMELRYGYNIERNHTFIRSEDAPFDLTVKIARLTTSGLVDRRDDPFNPGRGWFMASTFELSKPGLGSDLSFLKEFAQYSHFVPLRRGIVVASGARLGLARTFEGEVLVPSEHFFAGGANTVRGYREGDLGPRSVLGDAEGGSALLVLNGEMRFHVFKWLGGVGFLDAGNVYPKISSISLSELQVGAGAGARLNTPLGLFRFDFGVPVNRRPSDPRWRFHFGLGHAF